jgi:hypothetical protein
VKKKVTRIEKVLKKDEHGVQNEERLSAQVGEKK